MKNGNLGYATKKPFTKSQGQNMSSKHSPITRSNQPIVYQIRIEGHLDCQWTEWFDGLTITPNETGETVLAGVIVDQAALYGLLKKVRDLGMPLVSVIRVQAD